ncbi:MAG: ABC transporter ATP-binding protein [Eubacteriales bacterium]|nr:ABC transporter ATP-binding protein [Eubacteriales bacterium]
MKHNEDALLKVKSTRDLLLLRPFRFLVYIIACFFPILSQVTMAYAISNVLGLLQFSAAEDWKRALIWAVAYALGAPLLQMASRFMRIGYMRDTLLDLRKLTFRQIISLPYQTFSRKSRDSYVSKLTNDISLFEKDFFLSLLNVIFAIGAASVSLILILLQDIILGLIIAALAGILLLLSRIFRKPLIQAKERILSENEIFSLKMGNLFSGLEIIRLNNVEERFAHDTELQFEELETAKNKGRLIERFQEMVLEKTSILIGLASLIYVTVMMVQGQFTLAKAMLLMQLSGNIAWPLISLFGMRNRLIASNKVFRTLVESPEDFSEEERGETSAKISNMDLLSEDIELKDLTYQFGDATEPVLRQANLQLKGQGKYLLKGVSGAGKTTLLNLISGALRDYEGEITYGGVDLRDIDESTFNDGTALILQDVFLFETTVRENICLFKDYSDEEIERAVRLSGLTSLIEKLPQGLDTELSEDGQNLSGGERQRVSIARAIIKRSRLLLADEVTSALDPELGREIEQGILNLPMTVVAISHRYYAGISEQYDGVIELKQGKLSLYPTEYYFDGHGLTQPSTDVEEQHV